MKTPRSSNPGVADYKISVLSFAVPLFFVLGAAFLQNTIAEPVSIWGLLLCVLVSPFALVVLFFKLPRRIKHALGSFLLGVFIAVVLGIWGSSISLSGTSLHG